MLKKLFRRFNWLRDVREPAPENDNATFELQLGALQVGTLSRESGEWIFSYSDSFRAQNEVAPIIDFPRTDRMYRSKDLWPFFALRVPSLTQANVQRYLKRNGKTEVDTADLMQEFGKKSAANPFVLESV